ncbi:polysaccharide deacetylase family protein [Xanthobacter sp. TB0139]|uniref:polysaccharide deacetylase family protein n=1 Tax=Xanthobacter sp. TB0139 TaxID=3459178 RepID=UPI00403A6A63
MKPLVLLSGCLALGAAGVAFAFAPGLTEKTPTQAELVKAALSAPDVVHKAHDTFRQEELKALPETPSSIAARKATKTALVSYMEEREAVRAAAETVRTATVESVAGKRQVAYRSFNVDQPYIALTFDDGPNPETTPRLLDMLKERGVKATFFVLGTRAAKHPEILRRMVEEGHEIGNHSWSHPQLTRISTAASDKQITDASQAIFDATGQRPVYLRPPYGAMRGTLQNHIHQKFDMSFLYWSIDPLDWKYRDSKVVYENIISQAKPGAIVLMHDIHATTVDAMPQVLDDLIAKGYRFGTITQMVALDKTGKPAARHVANARPAASPETTGSISTARIASPRPAPAPQPAMRPATRPAAAPPPLYAPAPATAAAQGQQRVTTASSEPRPAPATAYAPPVSGLY